MRWSKTHSALFLCSTLHTVSVASCMCATPHYFLFQLDCILWPVLLSFLHSSSLPLLLLESQPAVSSIYILTNLSAVPKAGSSFPALRLHTFPFFWPLALFSLGRFPHQPTAWLRCISPDRPHPHTYQHILRQICFPPFYLTCLSSRFTLHSKAGLVRPFALYSSEHAGWASLSTAKIQCFSSVTSTAMPMANVCTLLRFRSPGLAAV